MIAVGQFVANREASKRSSGAWDPATPGALFDAAGFYKGPRDWESLLPPKGRDKLPVAHVTFSPAPWH